MRLKKVLQKLERLMLPSKLKVMPKPRPPLMVKVKLPLEKVKETKLLHQLKELRNDEFFLNLIKYI